MRKLLLIILILTTSFTIGTSSRSPNAIRNWYFDAIAGSDAGLGTIGSPYKTITKLNSIFPTISAGDSVLFKRDQTFAGTISVNKSGTSLLPITISGYNTGAKPIISGLTNLTTWISLGANIWECSQVLTVSSINLLLVNGSPVGMGRYPNLTAANGGYLTINNSTGTTSITCNALGNTPNWTGATLVMRPERWIMDRDSITKHTGTLINYTASSVNAPSKNMGFFIENSVLTLDVQNEWYYNPSSRKMRMFSTVNPNTLSVQVATTRTLLTTLTNKSFVTVDGVNFTGANDTAINITAGSNFTVKNARIQNIGNIGIHSAGTVTTVTNDTTWDCENNGIYCNNSAVNAIVRNCYVYRTHMIAGMGHSGDFQGEGINVRGDGALAEFNTVINTGYVGVYMYHNTGIIVQNNIVDSFGMVKDDGGGIYTYLGSSSPVSGCKIKNNIVRNGIGAPLGTSAPTIRKSPGIYLDINTNGFEVTGNSCYQNAENGIFMNSGASANTIYNNTLYNNTGIQFQINSRRTAQTRTNSIKNNIFFAVTTTQQAMEYYSTMFPSDINLFGTIDSNYILRPLNDNLTIIQGLSTSDTTVAVTNMNLASWKTAHATLDVHSQKAPATITSVNQLKQIVNQTTGTVVSPLAGNWKDARNVSYSTNISLNNFSTASLIPTGALIIPTITWANPAAITYPTALSGTQLNATASVPGTFSYTPGIGTILNAGTQNLIVLFTPTDGSTYSSASKTVTIVVNKASATLTYTVLSRVYTGLPQGVGIVTVPAGLTVINTLYNSLGLTPTNVGSYAVTSALVNQNYTAPNISGTYTITPAPASITVSNLLQVYDGTSKSVNVVTTPIGLSYTVLYNGSPTLPMNAGNINVTVTITDPNYSASPVVTTLVISKKIPTVSWATPASITYPTALSGVQLNAVSSVPGVLTYSPASGFVPNVGTQLLSVNFVPTDNINYASVNNTTVSLVVNKGTTTLTISDTIQYFDNTTKPITAIAGQSGTITILYAGNPTPPIAVGNYPFTVTFSSPNWQANSFAGTLHILPSPAGIVITNFANRVYTGSPISPTVTSSYSYSLTFNGSTTIPTNVGSYTTIATINDGSHSGADTVTMTIIKATPSTSWGAISSGVYPYVVGSGILNATSPVSGSFSYSVSVGDILTVGTTVITATFTPTSTANYNIVTITNSVIVTKGTDVIVVTDTTQSFDGLPKPITATSSHGGTLTILYGGSPTVPTAVGNYPFTVSYSSANWQATTVSGTLHITSNPATIFITNFANLVYTGSPISPTVTCAYSYSLTFNGSATVPTNVNSYITIATINDGIHTGADTVIMTIIKANPSTTWGAISPLTYPAPLSGTQLNLTSPIAGAASYSPPSGTVLAVGTHVLNCTYTPTDLANYNIITVTNSIVINKGTTTITVSDTIQYYDGTAKPITAIAGQSGTLTILYGGSPTVPIAVGDYPFTVSFSNANWQASTFSGTLHILESSASIVITNFANLPYTGIPISPVVTSAYSYSLTFNGSATIPTAVGNYTTIATINDGLHTGADTVIMSIIKADPVIVWPTPANIVYGTLLSATQQNASSAVAGVLSYLPISGTLLNAGTYVLSVTLTPTDGSNYNTVSKTVVITVTKATATLTLGSLSATYDSTLKIVVVTSNPINLSGISILYNGSVNPPRNAGSYPILVTLVNSNYSASPLSGTLVIAKANPSLTWVQPQPIKSGVPLSSIQLNAASNIPGQFTYSPAAGSILPTGTQRIQATFVPTDSVNYNTTVITVAISVFGNPVQNFYIRHGHVDYQELP